MQLEVPCFVKLLIVFTTDCLDDVKFFLMDLALIELKNIFLWVIPKSTLPPFFHACLYLVFSVH